MNVAVWYIGTELLPYWSFMLGFSTVAHSVEKRYGFLWALGDSDSGVGRSQAKSLAMPERVIFARLVGTK